MANETEAKTKSIGTLQAADCRKIAGWKTYKEASDAYSAARQHSQKTKNALREQIKTKLVAAGVITDTAEIDFSATPDGVVAVIEILQKTGRKQRAVNIITLS